MRQPVTVLLSSLTAATLLAACSSSTSGTGTAVSSAGSTTATTTPASSAASSTAPSISTAPSSSAATSTSAAPAGSAAAPLSIGKPFTNKPLGESGEVLAWVPSVPVPSELVSKYAILQDAKVVAVQVRITASSKYYDSAGPDSFALLQDDGTENASTSIFDDTAIGTQYAPLKDAETGKTSTGWVFFTPPKDTAKPVLEYKGVAAQGSDGSDIPALTVKIPLT